MLFDAILVGSKPCAVAALSASPMGRKMLIVTGDNPKLEATAKVIL
jgi:hypothetical protein